MALASILATHHRLRYEGVYHTNYCWLKGQHSSDCQWHDEWLAQVRMGLPSCYRAKLQAELWHNEFQDLGLGVAEQRRSANLGGFPLHFQKDEFTPKSHQELMSSIQLQVGIDDSSSMTACSSSRSKLDVEFAQLAEDQWSTTSMRVCLPSRFEDPTPLPHHIIQNAIQIFHIDHQRSRHLVILIQHTSLMPCKNWASASLSFVVITLSADVWDSGHPTLWKTCYADDASHLPLCWHFK